jgi:hypothetical protein
MGISLGAAFGMSNVIIPRGGPKAVSASLDFSNTPAIEIDGEGVVSRGQIEFIQGAFIDNSANATAFTLEMGNTTQKIVVGPNMQGYFPILMTNPPHMTARTTQANGRVIPIIFYNVPIQSASWKSN